MSPKRWPEICRTNEEKLFFVALSMNPDKEWRSADGLAQELGWAADKLQAFLDRFCQLGLVIKHPTNPRLWGYWERVQNSKT